MRSISSLGFVAAAVLAALLLVSMVGCSGGTIDAEPTPNNPNPPPVEGIDPASLKP